jgi:hypothetical protein
MAVILVVAATRILGRASVRIGRSNLEQVFVDVIAVRMMQMAIMQMVGVSGVSDSHVTTRRMMLVRVLLMSRTSAHYDLLLECEGAPIQFNSAP